MEDLTSIESTFIDMIKDSCIAESNNRKLNPSVIGALGISISNWGTSNEFFITRNIYMLPIDNNWSDRCYSRASGKVYNSPEECTEYGVLLYRVYYDHRDSIKDFTEYLISVRRSSNNSPLKYSSIIGCNNYKESINRLVRSNFFKDYLNLNVDNEYIGNLLNIIEKYELYKWLEDNDMSKKNNWKYNTNQNNIVEESEDIDDVIMLDSENVLVGMSNLLKEQETTEEDVTPVTSVEEHIYRVRLDWDKRDTQIFSSKNPDEAIDEAKKHNGYKVYIDDDGELFDDPWKAKAEEEEKIEKFGGKIKDIICTTPGFPVNLEYTPVYRLPFDAEPFLHPSGLFYIYDSFVINNRARITKHKETDKIRKPDMILGYIDIN